MRAAFPASASHRPGEAPIARRENSAAAARELAGSAGGLLTRGGRYRETAAGVNQELAAHPGRKRATRAHDAQPRLKLTAFTFLGGGRGAGSVK